MGEVIWLDRHRERKEAEAVLDRLDAAVRRLDRVVGRRAAQLGGTVERELAAITRELAAGLVGRALERAERLTGMLEHPLASG
jgi:hypothetical protein